MENKGTEHEKKRSFKYVPLADQKEAVNAINSGEMTRSEAAELFGVSEMSIGRWLRKLEGGLPTRAKGRKKEEWRRIVQEIRSGVMTIEEAALNYGILDRSVIKSWMRKFDSELSPAKQNTQVNTMGSTGNFDEENRKLKQQLDQAQMKILALETMIEVAGEEYGEDLRKKFGSKQ
jgi:transposase